MPLTQQPDGSLTNNGKVVVPAPKAPAKEKDESKVAPAEEVNGEVGDEGEEAEPATHRRSRK